MTNTFTAIDFETAQGYRHSICHFGVVRIENRIM
jgi:DNA polymerase-3 subunit epsilon